MVKYALALTSAIIVLFSSSIANAAFLLEPYAGYGSSKSKGSMEGSGGGLVYGGRLGFRHMGFMGGGEYLAGSADMKDAGVTTTVSQQNMGAFAGYQFPMLGLRLFGTYFFSSTGSAATTPTFKFTKGSGWKLGAGVQPLPFLAVNLEYMHANYTQGEVGGLTGPLDPELEVNTFLVTLSFPLSF